MQVEAGTLIAHDVASCANTIASSHASKLSCTTGLQ
jgi:hypothetical protein